MLLVQLFYAGVFLGPIIATPVLGWRWWWTLVGWCVGIIVGALNRTFVIWLMKHRLRKVLAEHLERHSMTLDLGCLHTVLADDLELLVLSPTNPGDVVGILWSLRYMYSLHFNRIEMEEMTEGFPGPWQCLRNCFKKPVGKL